MSTLTGKSIGIALFLAAALLAALFAMGAFTPAGVSGHVPTTDPSISFTRLNLDDTPHAESPRMRDAYEWKIPENAMDATFDRVKIASFIIHPAEEDDGSDTTIDHGEQRVEVDSAVFSITGGNTETPPLFSISSTTGALRYNGAAMDFETTADAADPLGDGDGATTESVSGTQLVKLIISVTATGTLTHSEDPDEPAANNGAISATQPVEVWVTVTDQNDKPTVEATAGFINENEPGSGIDEFGDTIEPVFITDVTADDLDMKMEDGEEVPKDTLSYSLSGSGSGDFEIVENEDDNHSAVVNYVGAGLNYERYEADMTDDIVLTVTVDDGAGGTAETKINVDVRDDGEDEPPAMPAAPTVKPDEDDAADSTLIVTWDNPSNPGPMIMSYEVRYRQEGETDDDWEVVDVDLEGNRDTAARRMTEITGLDGTMKYEVQVRAYNGTGGGNSEWSASSALVSPSDEIPVDPADVTVPDAVTALVVVVQSDTAVLVSWAAPSAAPAAGAAAITGYTVKHWEVGMSQPEQGMDTTDTFLIISGLKPDTLYVVSVAAMNLGGTGATSAETVRTDAEPPAEPVAPEPLKLGVELSSYKADTNVKATINLNTKATIRGGSDIDVNVGGFGIPDGGIAEDQVLIYSNGTSSRAGQVAFNGSPDSITVSGSTITLSLPVQVVRGTDTQEPIIPEGDYQIVFKQNAGLTTPNSAGNKTISVDQDDDGTNDHEFASVGITSHVSVKPGWVKRGEAFAVTGKGINAPGDATVHLYDRKNDKGDYIDRNGKVVDPADLENLDLVESSVSLVLGRSSRDAGTVIVDGIDTTHSSFVANAIDATKDADAKGYNLLVMVDAAGNNVGHTYFGIQPTVSLDVTDVRRTGRVEVSVSDWYYGRITDAYINGIQVDLPDNTRTPHDSDTAPDDWWSGYSVAINNDQTATFTVVVNRDVRLGEMEVRLVGTTKVEQGTYTSVDAHKQTVNVGFFNLTLTPNIAVTDQVIRIEGTGFGLNVCIESIKVGEEDITEATTGDRVVIGGNTSNCVLTDSDGDVANSFKVPYNLKPDDYKVVVRDVNNRVGEAVLTVPEPSITLSPAASQRGSTVTVIGENFPAQDVIGITYGGDTVTVATTDTVGKWRATFKVPVDATIGREYEVVAQSDKKGDGQQTGPTTPPRRANLNAEATHTVPEETLKVWPAGQVEPPDDTADISEIASGGRLQVKATNLPPHTKVSLFIGDIPVAGKVLGEDAAADSSGEYSDSVLVPQLTVGTHTVELDVDTVGSDVVVVTFVEILDIITRPTADVFEDQIAAGQLLVVWRYDNATATWASYSPTAPAELNDLGLVSTGDIVWVEVTENVAFQGQTLYAGWNLISLE